MIMVAQTGKNGGDCHHIHCIASKKSDRLLRKTLFAVVAQINTVRVGFLFVGSTYIYICDCWRWMSLVPS
jgi:hypothetical protein